MAVKLYFGNNTPIVSPTFTTGWEVTGTRRTLELEKDMSRSALETITLATALNSPAGAVDVAMVQYVGPPVAANITVAAAIRGQAQVQESNAAADFDTQAVLWWMKPDGTVRGTSFTFDASALSHEWNTALRNISIPKGGSVTPTSVAVIAGDRPVLELGYRKHESATTNRTGTLSSGNPSGTDLPVDETTTTLGIPWIEFTDNVTFTLAPARVSQVVQQAALEPTPAVRVSQVVQQAALEPTPALRVSQVTMQVAVSGAVDVSPAGGRTQIVIVG